MATSIEAAGIILAVLPLFISAFEHYESGLEPFKAFWNMNGQLPIHIRKLRNQHVHSEQTLRLLLVPVTEADEISEMIDHPNGELWKLPDMQARLERRLGKPTMLIMRQLHT